MDPTKLVSHFSEFSVILYTIYKNQRFTLTIEVYLCEKDPGNSLGFAIGPLRWPAGAAGQNSGGSPRVSAGEGCGEDLGVLGDRFVGCLEPVVAGGRGCAGGQEHWPPRLAVPARGWGTGGGCVPAGCGGAKGGVGEALGGTG
jgi:hypothetical protein